MVDLDLACRYSALSRQSSARLYHRNRLLLVDRVRQLAVAVAEAEQCPGMEIPDREMSEPEVLAGSLLLVLEIRKLNRNFRC